MTVIPHLRPSHFTSNARVYGEMQSTEKCGFFFRPFFLCRSYVAVSCLYWWRRILRWSSFSLASGAVLTLLAGGFSARPCLQVTFLAPKNAFLEKILGLCIETGTAEWRWYCPDFLETATDQRCYLGLSFRSRTDEWFDDQCRRLIQT